MNFSALIHRKSFLSAWSLASPVAPSRTPKPVLQNLLLRVAGGIATLSATDLEVGVTVDVAGVKAEGDGSVLLSPKFGQILTSGKDEELSIKVGDDQIDIRGLRSKFVLPTENPDEMPTFPEPEGEPITCKSADLRGAMRLTSYATDVESTRYALGGIKFEVDEAGTTALVGTDGRRLAWAKIEAESGGRTANGVIPLKAIKAIEKILAAGGSEEVEFWLTVDNAHFRTETALLYTRLVEGRFPKYSDIFPTQTQSVIEMEVGSFREALEQSTITTSDESRGVDFTFSSGSLTLASKSSDVGSGLIDLATDYDGAERVITLDPRYLLDALKVISEETVELRIIDGKHPVEMKVNGTFRYVVMPITCNR